MSLVLFSLSSELASSCLPIPNSLSLRYCLSLQYAPFFWAAWRPFPTSPTPTPPTSGFSEPDTRTQGLGTWTWISRKPRDKATEQWARGQRKGVRSKNRFFCVCHPPQNNGDSDRVERATLRLIFTTQGKRGSESGVRWGIPFGVWVPSPWRYSSLGLEISLGTNIAPTSGIQGLVWNKAA